LARTTENQPAALPASLGQAVHAEFGRALDPPYEVPSVVVGNGALMILLWVLLPAAAVDAVFTLHGPLAFALVLATWMYSDVPATNLLGGDAVRSVAALPDPAMLRRLWLAKNIVVWAHVTPLCTVAAVVIGVDEGRLTTTLLSVVWIAVVPLGALGFAAWLGIWLPYHPVPLRYRWANRRHWRQMIARWLLLVLTPYGLVPALTAVLTLPSLLLWTAAAPSGNPTRITDAQFAWGLLLAAALAAIAWPGGHLIGSRLAHRRRRRLTEFLTDPDRG
jgi:hypothetical protein